MNECFCDENATGCEKLALASALRGEKRRSHDGYDVAPRKGLTTSAASADLDSSSMLEVKDGRERTEAVDGSWTFL